MQCRMLIKYFPNFLKFSEVRSLFSKFTKILSNAASGAPPLTWSLIWAIEIMGGILVLYKLTKLTSFFALETRRIAVHFDLYMFSTNQIYFSLFCAPFSQLFDSILYFEDGKLL